jgi:lipid-A-disaccharide synthase
MADQSLYIVAGELSGDAHAAGMLRALLARQPALRVLGAGGPAMTAACGHPAGLRDWVEEAAVVGVWEVVRRYGWFRERFHEILAEIRRERPRVLVLVDYPGFNLRLAAAARAALPDLRIVYYISPQVWAWHRRRVKTMARVLDEMLCILPFEQEFFAGAGLPTRFVGHPLVDELAGESSDLERDPGLVGLFPGSRKREVGRLFPLMLEAARRLHLRHPEVRFEVPAASPQLAGILRAELARQRAAPPVQVRTGGSHALMQRAHCAVIASGTATLEAAWFGLPYCLVYKVSWPTYLLGRLLVRLPHIGLVNILAGREVVAEFIQGDADPCEVEQALGRFLDDPVHRGHTVAALADTVAKLGGPGAHDRAAAAIAAHFA